ncbi:hypothetical protein AB0O28_18900 [Microbispora sp. NPDC088329]|uniref:hypothetical protein n=1 Tax=Microbispora sp. NPDC088329 TaxID=3154869 RepID=UPI0034298916
MTCDHSAAVPVESIVTGEVLAALCPACDTQLPAEFLGCPHENTIEITSLGEVPGTRHVCIDCGTTGRYRPQLMPTIANTNIPTTVEITSWPGAMF